MQGKTPGLRACNSKTKPKKIPRPDNYKLTKTTASNKLRQRYQRQQRAEGRTSKENMPFRNERAQTKSLSLSLSVVNSPGGVMI